MGKKKRKSSTKDADDDKNLKKKRHVQDDTKFNESDSKSKEKSKEEVSEEIFTLEDRVIESYDDGKVYIALEPQEDISFIGKAKIRTLVGSVSIFGFEITSSEKIYDIYSPNCNSFLTVSNKHDKTCTKCDTINKMTNSDVRTKLKSVVRNSKCSSVIELISLEQDNLNFITGFTQFQQLFIGSSKQGYKDSIDIETVGVQIIRDRYANVFSVSEDYLHVKETVLKHMATDCPNTTVAFCGGKNSGKSTLGRYMINSLLNRTGAVAFLECDIGQTEFTPSGCVSLNIVDKPVLGPPFTHMRQPDKCCFYGLLTPAENPEEYLKCVKEIYQHYKQEYKDIPLLVNTMGWNKGIGISILVDTLKITEPDFLIQLDTRFQSRNLPPMKPTSFGCDAQQCLESFDDSDTWQPKYKLMIIQARYVSQHEVQEKFKPVDHRTLSLLSYLGTLWLPGGSLISVQPYSVPWGSVSVYVPAVAPSHIMYALNCSVVGLCSTENEQTGESESSDVPKVLKTLPRSGCLGFGLVRAIDPIKKLFYIITPLTSHVLQKVNVLVRGALDVPQQVMLKQKSGVGVEIPYVGIPKDTVGATSIKPRKHMGRHYKQLQERKF